MNKIVFEGFEFNVIQHTGQPYLTIQEIGQVLYGKEGSPQTGGTLHYASKKVNEIYRRHKDEFRVDMTALIRLQTAGGWQEVRVFSLRGCHLLGMFARTKVAKRFRVWALDVLDEHLNEGKGWHQEFNKAWLEYTSERAMASLCGKGLRRWQSTKNPLQIKVDTLAKKAQVALPF